MIPEAFMDAVVNPQVLIDGQVGQAGELDQDGVNGLVAAAS